MLAAFAVELYTRTKNDSKCAVRKVIQRIGIH